MREECGRNETLYLGHEWAKGGDLDMTSDGRKLEKSGGFFTGLLLKQDLFLLLVGPKMPTLLILCINELMCPL